MDADGKYLGDTQSKSSRMMVRGLPDSENCSLWVYNISPKANYAEIFSKIKSGAIFSLHLTASDDDHSAAAATLVFKKHQAAADFMAETETTQGVWLRGKRLYVRYNRNGHREYEGTESRILQVETEEGGMDVEDWKAYFGKFCVFQWEWAGEVDCKIEGRKASPSLEYSASISSDVRANEAEPY